MEMSPNLIDSAVPNPMTLESFPSNVSIVLLVLRKSVVGKTLALRVTDLLHAIQIQTWLVSTLRSIGPASRTEIHDKLPNSVGLLDCWKFPSISCHDSIKNVFKLNFQGLSRRGTERYTSGSAI
jgi:hypothetical protein